MDEVSSFLEVRFLLLGQMPHMAVVGREEGSPLWLYTEESQFSIFLGKLRQGDPMGQPFSLPENGDLEM